MPSANSLNGGIILNEGALDFNTPSALGVSTNPIFLNGGTLYPVGIGISSGTYPWLFGPSGGTVNLDPGQTASRSGADMFGNGSLTLTGSGTLSVGSASSPFSGQVYLNQGTINMAGSRFGSVQGMTVAAGAQYVLTDSTTATYSFASGAVLTLNGAGPGNLGAFALAVGTAAPTTTFSNPVYLASNSLICPTVSGANTPTLILSGPIFGPGSLTVGGSGTLRVSSANNAYGGPAGTTSVLNGTLQVANVNSLPATTSLVLGDPSANTSATFDLNNQTQTVASLLTAGNGSNNQVISSGTASAGVLTVNYQGNTPMVYTGALGGSAANFALAVTGSGVVVLAGGNNTYTQGTTIGPGATLQLGNVTGQGGIINNVTDNGSLVFANGSVNNGGLISGTGSITLTQGSTITLAGSNTYSGATFIQNGALTASGAGTGTPPLPATTTVVLGDPANDPAILQVGDQLGPVNQTVAGLGSLGTGSGNSVVGGNAANSTLSVNLTTNSTYNGALGDATFTTANGNNLALA